MSRQLAFVLGLLVIAGAAAGLFLLTREESAGPTSAPSAGGSRPSPADTPAEPVRAEPATPADAPAPAAATASAPPARPRAEVAPEDVSITVEADVAGAQVFLDRQFIGTTPVTRFGVPPGRHQINVVAPGYDSHVESRDFRAGHHDVSVRFREVRLDVRTEVVHRHGVGSCRGTLVATAEGVRYDTDHDDGFSSPLTGIEEVQVDYLENQLRVRVRGGRQYDFSHPSDDADSLLVFGREVNRARARLLGGDAATP